MPQCQSFTLRGAQCRREALDGAQSCTQHAHLTVVENERRRLIVPQRLQEEENFRNAVGRAREIVQRVERAAQQRRQAARRLPRVHNANRPDLQRVNEDPQNVHLRDVRAAQQPVLDALARQAAPFVMVRPPFTLYTKTFKDAKYPKETFRQMLRRWFKPAAGRTPVDFVEIVNQTQRDTLFGNFRMTATGPDGAPVIVSLFGVLCLAIYAVCNAPAEHREPLRQRLLQEVADGQGYCTPGRFARILNAFAGFEEVVLGIPPVDPRGMNERLGDAFAALSKKEMADDARRLEGERILNENDIHDPAQRAVWLEAL
jgi:hypothetical protein